MQNFVNFETAVALKNAGFQQPKPAFGQVWYTVISEKPRRLCLTGQSYVSGNKYYFFFENGGECTGVPAEWVFAPTVTDILRSLPDGAIRLRKFRGDCVADLKLSSDYGTDKDESSGFRATGEDAVKVLAALYLKTKEKEN